uniref:SGNH hydrolase-type esterase domain-containing protein n=1 Tax=Gadus morhua TaxID=8049 RepID=A0A8C5BDF2_GADMO
TQNGYSSSRRRLLQEAVSRRSAPEAELPEAEPDGASPLQPSVEQPLQGASGTTATTHCIPGPKIPVIQPLFPPSTLIIGDSITRHLRFFNLRDMLPTLPSTIRRIICDKSVFVSGPIPTIGRGNERFSRLLSLNTWLRDTCGETNVGFIENFDVFWNRQSLYLRDGLHPNAKGSRLLAANIHYTMTCIDTSRCSRHAQK